MNIDDLLSDYEVFSDRKKRFKADETGPVDPANLYITALKAGAGIDSLVRSILPGSTKTNLVLLNSHPQHPFLIALLGNLPDATDAFSLLDVKGFATEDDYHASRKKAIKAREDILLKLEEHQAIERKLRDMVDADTWESRAASLIADVRAAEEKMSGAKPELNAWVKSYEFFKSISAYPTYDAVVSNFVLDKQNLFSVASSVASALGERAVAFFFNTVDGTDKADPLTVRKALRYIAWNMTYNSLQVAGLTGEGPNNVLPLPFDKAPTAATTFDAASTPPKRRTFTPSVEGDAWMEVLKRLDTPLTLDEASDATTLQAFHLTSRNNIILASASTLKQSLLGDESHPLDRLDVRAEELLKQPDRPTEIKQDQTLAATTAHPSIETIRLWVKNVYEPVQQSLSQKALALIEEIRESVQSNNPEHRLRSMPPDVLKMDGIPVDKTTDLPFKPAVVAAMDRVASLVHDNVNRFGGGLYTRDSILKMPPRIVEKFANATAKQMILNKIPNTRPTAIMYTSATTETATAIAELANAILEN